MSSKRHTCISWADSEGGACAGTRSSARSLFGIVYMKTVATFPEAMFYVFMVVVFISLFFLFFVRIPPESKGMATEQGVEVEVDAPAATTAVASAPVTS